jgi:hypothetical protein
MRYLTLILGLAIASAGCTSSGARVSAERDRIAPPPPAAAALAFTPPVTFDGPDLDLSRDGRGPAAISGYEETVVSTTWVRQDDRQRWGRWGDYSQFERRSISTTVTVRK